MDAIHVLRVGEKYDYAWTCTKIWPGDTIQAVVWTVPAGLTKSLESHTDTTATVWLERTGAGMLTVTGKITSTAGRVAVVEWLFIE